MYIFEYIAEIDSTGLWLWDFPRQLDGEDPTGVFKSLKSVDLARKLFQAQNLPKFKILGYKENFGTGLGVF